MRVVIKRSGIKALLVSPQAQADLAARAEAIASACGPGYAATPAQTPRRRAHRVVSPQTPEAKADNATNNTLIRNLDAGR